MTASKSSRGYDSEKHCGGEKRGGGLCTRPKGWGTQHQDVGRCKLHGGCTPTHEAAGQLTNAQAASKLLAIPVATNPFSSLLQLESEAMGYVEYFRRKVQELDPDAIWVRPTSILRRPLDGGKDGEDPSIEVTEITAAPFDLNIAIKAHRQAMEDLRKISKTVIAAGVAERMVKLEEARGEAISLMLQRLLPKLGVTVDAKTAKIVQAELTTLEDGDG